MYQTYFTTAPGNDLADLLCQPIEVDIVRSDDAYILRADAPGLKRADIDVAVDGDTLTIAYDSGQDKPASTDSGYVLRERAGGKRKRRLRFREPLDSQGVSARLDNGVLEITVPRQNGRKQVAIQ